MTPVFHLRWLVLSLSLILISFAPLSSQSHALIAYGHAGRTYSITNLSEVDDLSPGMAFGGGLGVQLGRTTAVRANLSVSNSSHRGTTLSLSDTAITRFYYGMDMLFGSPSNGGLAPYMFFGGGRLVVDPAQAGTETVGKWAGRLGTGVNYVPDNSFFVLFAEVSGLVYQFKLHGFDKLQLDMSILGGLAFALPY